MPTEINCDAKAARPAEHHVISFDERKKQRLIRASESKEGKVGLSDVVKARNGWIRTVRAFVGIIDLEKNLAEELRRRILGPLEDADRREARRGGKESSEEASEEDTGSEQRG